MSNAQLLAAVIGPVYLIIGLSLLIYVKQWQKIFAGFTDNHFQMLANMMLALILGLFIINIYNVWSWNVYLIITITGWIALVKALFYFLAPASLINGLMKTKWIYSNWCMYAWGCIAVIAGILLSYNVYIA